MVTGVAYLLPALGVWIGGENLLVAVGKLLGLLAYPIWGVLLGRLLLRRGAGQAA